MKLQRGERTEMKEKGNKAEYMREYRKRKAKVLADVDKTEREQLNEVLKQKNMTMAEWIRQHIKNDYEQLRQTKKE